MSYSASNREALLRAGEHNAPMADDKLIDYAEAIDPDYRAALDEDNCVVIYYTVGDDAPRPQEWQFTTVNATPVGPLFAYDEMSKLRRAAIDEVVERAWSDDEYWRGQP